MNPQPIRVKVRLIPRVKVKVTALPPTPVQVRIRSTDQVLEWQKTEW